jgi:hypothetical protein
MNKRIRELESQCWEERPYGPPWFDAEKFAELLIRECAKVADTVEAWDIAPSGVIEKHFGVE